MQSLVNHTQNVEEADEVILEFITVNQINKFLSSLGMTRKLQEVKRDKAPNFLNP